MFVYYILSFVGVLFFAITSVLVHFHQEKLHFRKDILSRYATGEKGWILTIGLYSMSMAEMALAVGIITRYQMNYGSLFLLLSALGSFVAATFKVGAKREINFSSVVHNIGAFFAFVFFSLSLFFFTQVLIEKELIVLSDLFSKLTGGLLFLIIGMFLFEITTEKAHKYFGLIQKVNILLIVIWMVYTSYLLI